LEQVIADECFLSINTLKDCIRYCPNLKIAEFGVGEEELTVEELASLITFYGVMKLCLSITYTNLTTFNIAYPSSGEHMV
jgi:hypothetical protein